jgi:beta-galactosidase
MFNNKFILGTQYFRVMPPRDEWADDFRHMKDMGIDTVKIEAVWSQIEYQLGKYDWSEIDGLMDTAKKAGLKVLMTLTFETIPDTVFKESGPRVINLERNPVPVKRGLGGVFRGCTCWDHPRLRMRIQKFVLAAARRYHRHPALLCWDIFQEIDIPTCACRHTTRAYRQWLKAQYSDIRKVNEYWGEHYRSFDDVEAPYSGPFEGQAYLDYNRFRSDCLAARIHWLYRLTKSVDKQHQVIAHAHSYPLQYDDWLVAKGLDFYGTSIHEFLYQPTHDELRLFALPITHLQVIRSLSRDKNYYWISELSAGSAFGAPHVHRRLNERELTHNLWLSVAYGAKGIYLWQFKPERIFFQETPSAWGLINLDGSETFRSKEFRSFAQVVRKNEKMFLEMKSPESDYGLLYLPDVKTAAGCLGYKPLSYHDAFYGIVFMMWINNVRFDILRFPEELKGYRLIYCPMPWILSQPMLAAIKQYVQNGGTFVADGGFMRYTEHGWVSTRVPGGGIAEAIKVHETDFALVDKVLIKTKIGRLCGAQERAWLECAAGERIGQYPDGKTAVAKSRLGKGWFITVGTSLAAHIGKSGDVQSAQQCAEFFGLQPIARVRPLGSITLTIQERGKSKIVFIFNNARQQAKADISFPFSWKKMEIMSGNGQITFRRQTLAVTLGPKETQVICFD